MTKNKFLALVYADLFSFPLSSEELFYWQINWPALRNWTEETINRLIDSEDGYYFLKGAKGLVARRKDREGYSLQKLHQAKKVADQLKKLPLIEAIYVTGSVAVGNATLDCDIDLMIITKPGSLWLTRLLVVSLLKIQGVYRGPKNIENKICTNLYLDGRHLVMGQKSLFVAHEILQARCLFDRDGCNFYWLKANEWVADFLPQAYFARLREITQFKKSGEVFWRPLFYPLEMVSFFLQICYMHAKMTREKVGWGYAFFHPNDLSGLIQKRFEQRLLKLEK